MIVSSLEHYFDRLWPICRSITGDGVRKSLAILQELIPLEIHEVPSGTKCFDWEVPNEWTMEDAYIITPDGRKICDVHKNNLHLVSYSTSIDEELTYEEIIQNIHTIPSYREAVPYKTSYYKEDWGFCMAQADYEKLPREGDYRAYIRTKLEPGHMTYGDLVVPGTTDREVLISTYICHPSMANNELSGPLVAAMLYKKLLDLPERRYTYRFVFAPETIGIIYYLSVHGEHMKKNVDAGYVLTCCGDPGQFHYKQSKDPDSLADRAARHVLSHLDQDITLLPFAVGGSDERQYCSPGFNLPVGSLMRTPYQKYKEYHTSLDNKDFISFDAMAETVDTYFDIIRTLELNQTYEGTIQHCEPQLGKRDMYPASADPFYNRKQLHSLMNLLSFADGTLDLIDIAEKRDDHVKDYEELVKKCLEKGLIKHA